MHVRDLNEKRNRLKAESKQITDSVAAGSDFTPEQRTRLDAIVADCTTIQADIDRMTAVESIEERALPSNRPPREGFSSDDKDERGFEARNKATNVALRSFLKGEKFESRDLTIAADGGVMLPVGALPPVLATKSSGSIYDIVGKIRTATGEDIRLPLWDDTANGLVLDSASIGAGTDPSVTGVTLRVDGLRTGDPLLIDNKLINDLSYDLVSYVNEILTQRYIIGISQYINAGNSSNFVGLTGHVPVGVTSATAGTLGYNDFVALITSLDPSYAGNAVFAMSNATLGHVLQIVDGEGRPIFIPYLSGATSGFAGQILGYPVKINQFAPAVASNAVPVIFGDFSKGYQLREVTPGLVIKQSKERWMELNRLGVVAFARAGGAPTLANATTYSPLQGLKVQ